MKFSRKEISYAVVAMPAPGHWRRKSLLMTLALFCRYQEDGSYVTSMTYDDIKGFSGGCNNTNRKHLKSLCDSGYIDIVKGKSHKYILNVPMIMEKHEQHIKECKQSPHQGDHGMSVMDMRREGYDNSDDEDEEYLF